MSITTSAPMSHLIADSQKAGLQIEETVGGLRIYRPDAEAEADGLYGLGVDILLNADGGFHSATRIDVDLSVTTTIRTIKAVRSLLLD